MSEDFFLDYFITSLSYSPDGATLMRHDTIWCARHDE